MEARFDHDFSGVRVHTDGAAAHAASEHSARAYTVGDDIVFGANQFAPSTQEGHRLIAHELAHVIQQRRGGQPPDASHEDDAESAAHAVLTGSAARVTAASARGVPQLTPEDDLKSLLALGPKVEPPTSEEINGAIGRVNSGKATAADQRILLRQTVVETRAFIQAGAGRPLDYTVVRGCCGYGRDIGAAALGGLASGSPTKFSIARFQSGVVFGVNSHGFTVVTFPDGRKYLIDPTFAQFFYPASSKNKLGKTGNVLRGDAAGMQFAIDLIRNGYVELDETTARLYARGLGVESGRESGAAANLLKGTNAQLVESVGKGQGTVFYTSGNNLDYDRRDLRKETESRLAQLRTEGDPYGLLPQLERLETRLQPPQVSAVEPAAVTVSGQIGGTPSPKAPASTPPPNPPSAPPGGTEVTVKGTTTPTGSTAGTGRSYTASTGAPLEPIVEATPGFNPGAGSELGNAIQVLQSHQFAGLQADEVAAFLKKYEQLQRKIEKFFQQGYSVEVALIVEKPDRPDVLCGVGVFCEQDQIIFFRDVFITRVESTAPPHFPAPQEYPVAYPAGGRDSFIPYTHQGGSIIEEHEIPHLTPLHPEHHTEYKKETFYPPVSFSFTPVQPKPAPPPPPPKPKLDLATRQKLAAAPSQVYLVSTTIKQAYTADIVAKRLTGNRSFGEVNQSVGGGFFWKRTRVVYWSTLDKQRAEDLAEIVRASGVPGATTEQSGDGDDDPGHVQVNFGEDASREGP